MSQCMQPWTNNTAVAKPGARLYSKTMTLSPPMRRHYPIKRILQNPLCLPGLYCIIPDGYPIESKHKPAKLCLTVWHFLSN